MAKTPSPQPDAKTPATPSRGVQTRTTKVVVSKQVFTDFAAI